MLTKEINLCPALPRRMVARQPWVKAWHPAHSLSRLRLLCILDSGNECLLHCPQEEHSPLSLHLNCSSLIIFITWCILVFQVYLILRIFCLKLCGLALMSDLALVALQAWALNYIWLSHLKQSHALTTKALAMISHNLDFLKILFQLINYLLSNICSNSLVSTLSHFLFFQIISSFLPSYHIYSQCSYWAFKLKIDVAVMSRLVLAFCC